jgi:hypothetical protein
LYETGSGALTVMRKQYSTLCSCVLVLTTLVGDAPFARQAPSQAGSYQIPLVQPVRRAPDAPPASPPELPAAAHRITPVTLDVIIRQTFEGRLRTARRRVSRTAERIHVMIDKNREWLFERNAVDPRRVSGHLIDHSARVIVHHDESDLRNLAGISGWTDVLAPGIGQDTLRQLQPTNRRRNVSGVSFERYVAMTQASILRDVWWSSGEALVLSLELQQGTERTQVVTVNLRNGVDANLLVSPAARFPIYQTVDVAEWLEGDAR